MKKMQKIIRNARLRLVTLAGQARRRLVTMARQAWDLLRAFCWVCLLAVEEPDEYEREFGSEKETR